MKELVFLAAPLAPACGTLVCQGTPVVNHWFSYYRTCFVILKMLQKEKMLFYNCKEFNFYFEFYARGEEIWVTTKTLLIETSFTVNSNGG